MFPNAVFYKRQGYPIKKIIEYATARDFTDVVVVNEDRRTINSLVVSHLPDGPTANFKLSSLKLSADIVGHGRATAHKPELVLNNFSTRLGLRVGRMFASLFNQDPTFRGRRVVTFHNQRDFIFFRCAPAHLEALPAAAYFCFHTIRVRARLVFPISWLVFVSQRRCALAELAGTGSNGAHLTSPIQPAHRSLAPCAGSSTPQKWSCVVREERKAQCALINARDQVLATC